MITVVSQSKNIETFGAGGLRWHCEADFSEHLRKEIVPHVESARHAGWKLIKDTNTRRVWRTEIGGIGYYIKIHKISLLGEKLKYMFTKSRAMSEWTNSRAFNEKGVLAAKAVAVGERRIAGILLDAVLISEEIPGAKSVEGVLPEADRRRRREVLTLSAELIRKSHDANLLHRDLHGGNIIISGSQAFFIDLHRAGVNCKVTPHQRIESLARFLAMLGGKVTWGERLHFLKKYYGDSDGNSESFHNYFVDVTFTMHYIREERFKSRAVRCVKKSSGFRIERAGLFKIYRVKDFPAAAIDECIKKHREASPDNILKEDARAKVTVVAIKIDSRQARVCVKEFVRRSPSKIFGDLFRGTPGMKAWLGSYALAARGIGTPKALALADSPGRQFFITEFVEDALRLNDFFARLAHPTTRDKVRLFRKMASELADFIRRLHSQSIRHKDLSAKNILVESSERGLVFRLVDTNDVRFKAPIFKSKVKNLGQLGQIYALPSKTMRHRFIRRYAGNNIEFLDREVMGHIDEVSRLRHENWLRNGGREILEEMNQRRSNA